MFNVPFYVIPMATGTHQMLEHQASELHWGCYCLQISYWLQMAISISCKLLIDWRVEKLSVTQREFRHWTEKEDHWGETECMRWRESERKCVRTCVCVRQVCLVRLWHPAPTLCVWLEWGLGGGWGLEGAGAWAWAWAGGGMWKKGGSPVSIHTCLPGMECIARPPGSETRAWRTGGDKNYLQERATASNVWTCPLMKHPYDYVCAYLWAWMHEEWVSSHTVLACAHAEAWW